MKVHHDKRVDSSTASTTILLRTSWQARNPDGRKCGLLHFYPDWLQKFATPRSFLICFCMKNILQGMIFTYLVGIETSLERHFQFDGKTVGLLLTLGEIGPIATAIWISHLGSRGNRPRWMALGLLLIALSLVLTFLMDLIFPPPELEAYQVFGSLNSLENGANKMICKLNDGNESSLVNASHTACTIDPIRRNWAFAAWVLIYSILGVGATTVYVIGAPYLDDSVSKKDSPFYFSITMAVRIIGPVFGYLLSSACLKLYVDLQKSPDWKSDDPRWIGAWWLGALIMAFFISAFAMVVGAFPRNMPKDQVDGTSEASPPQPVNVSSSTLDIGEDPLSTREQRTADFKAALIRLFRNPVLLASCASSVFTILGLVGYFIWLPKYFEHEFRISKSQASMYSGLSGNLSMIFGVLVSGYFMMKYHPTARQVAALVATSKYVYAVGLLLVMLANCDFNEDLPGTRQPDGSLKLDRGCNNECSCNTAEYVPVCLRGTSGKSHTFFSPCHAGCMNFTSANQTIAYNSCKCDMTSTVTPGFCVGTCSNVYIYMALLAIIKLIVSFSAVGNLIIDLRCVEERDKALALGLIAAVSSLLGFLPAPVIYGTLIDSSCLVWEKSCGQTGSCWVYDTEMFRYKLHGLTAACLTVAGAFEVITYFKVKNLELFKTNSN